MEVSESAGDNTLVRKARKKRLPKACVACRNSKARCDGQSPCSRCRHRKKECLFEKIPKDERDSRIEHLELEIDDLKSKLHAASVASQSSNPSHPGIALREEGAGWPRMEQLTTTPSLRPPDTLETLSNAPTSISPTSFVGSLAATRLSPQVNSQCPDCRPSKKRRTYFETKLNTPSDVLTMGLISPTEAESYFQTFFQGCHQYVPVLSPLDDSMEQIRARSGILFSVICASGCRILKGTDSQAWRSLNFHVRRLLNIAVGSPSIVTLETIQALLIRASYVSERSFLTTLATRFAIELGIPESFDDLISRSISPSDKAHSSPTDDDKVLARKSRTWLHIMNMGHILHVDASDVLLFKMRGSSRRCRVLLQGTLKADLDLHLISQVELNVLRAETYAALSTKERMSEEDILAIVREARIDTNVWFNDWLLIFSQASSRSQEQRLAQNLEIQKCWAETMTLCRAIRLSGVDNVDAMSVLQREMLAMAKDSLAKHLDIIIQEPRLYLQNLRYAMDFVWAKCAFCFLLLLKLSILLPDNREETRRELLEHGRTLIQELRNAADVKGTAGRNINGNYNSTRHIYLQILQSGLENFSRTVFGVRLSSSADAATGTSTPRQRFEGTAGADEQNDLDSFVLEQFVFEWDFPGLTLFSSPITEAGWLDDFLSNAIMGDEDFYNFGYVPS